MANTHKVVVHVEGRPKDELVEVLYLGLFANGGTHDLSDEQVASWEAVTGNTFPKSGYIFAGAPHGPAQEKAFKENAEEIAVYSAARDEDLTANPTQTDAISTNQLLLVVENEAEGDK